MLRKLKYKFVLFNMLSVGLILCVMVSTVIFTSYQRQQEETNKILENTLFEDVKKSAPKLQIGAHDTENRFQNYAAFLVTINEDGTVNTFLRDNLEVSQEILDAAITYIETSENSSGRIPDLNLSYQLIQTETETRIAFLDTSFQDESFGHLVIILLSALFFGLLLFFVISLRLAKWSVKPVEDAWNQQRQFIADASHELKTPLTVILANTGIMMNHKNDTIFNQMKWLNYIKEEADHMKKLIEDMLFLAKNDAGRSIIPMDLISLSDLAFEVSLPFESVAFEKNIVLETQIEDGLLMKGNYGQLKELISILLDNACKYTPEKETILLSLNKSQDKIKLQVKNTGVYISTDVIDHLFERFYRPDQSRNLQTGGYGLGLSIAKSITELHKGWIQVTSSPQDGTSFIVTLPTDSI